VQREVRWMEGRKGVFGILRTRRRLCHWRCALRRVEAGEEAVDDGQCPASIPEQTSRELITQP
jgi:hypothetical protein